MIVKIERKKIGRNRIVLKDIEIEEKEIKEEDKIRGIRLWSEVIDIGEKSVKRKKELKVKLNERDLRKKKKKREVDKDKLG